MSFRLSRNSRLNYIPISSLCASKLIPKNFHLPHVIKDIAEVNRLIRQEQKAHWEELCISRNACVFRIDVIPPASLLVCKGVLQAMRTLGLSLKDICLGCREAYERHGWSTAPLPWRGTGHPRVGFACSPACTQAVKELADLEDKATVRSYLQRTWWHCLECNQEPDDGHIAWFGNEDGPLAVLINTGHRQEGEQLLLMLLRQRNPDMEDSIPWVAVGLVRSSELKRQHDMRRHLAECLPKGVPDAEVVLEHVPLAFTVPPQHLTVEPGSRFLPGNILWHVRDRERWTRLPEEYRDMDDTELALCIDDAVDRAWRGEVQAMVQYFYDRHAEGGEYQLVLPLALGPPPREEAHMGLVLRASGEEGARAYTAVTWLTLEVCRSNARQLQPMAPLPW